MKAVILAGGSGWCVDADIRHGVKAMIEIGGRPMLWHIMKMYDAHGISDFIVCCDGDSHAVRDYFARYDLHRSDITFDLSQLSTVARRAGTENWRVTVVDIGRYSPEGSGLKRVAAYLAEDEAFCFTYGDAVASIDIGATIAFHRTHGQPATIAAVCPPARHGALHLDGTEVRGITEKADGESGFINGGFFVLSPTCFDGINDDATAWDGEPLKALAAEGRMRAYRHEGFWQPLDTPRDKNHLESLWQSGAPPWKVW